MPDTDRIIRVFESLRGSLARAVQHIVPPREIEDIVQETYVRVCQAGGEQEIRSPRSFMFRTARNLALDYVKRAETRLSDSFDESDEAALPRLPAASDSTLDRVCAEEEFSQFCDSVRFLPEQCRRAFVLRKVYGYSQKEIARAMHLSEKTVEKHISMGIRRCMEYMVRNNLQPKEMKSVRTLRVVGGNRQGGQE